MSFIIMIIINGNRVYDKMVQNKIIDNIYIKEIRDDDSFLGYIYIPRYDIKRLIKNGTSSAVLDSNYVGMHKLSDGLESSNFLILAGHNTSNVFSVLHKISIDDDVYIKNKNISRRFVVYDKKYVNEYEMSYLYSDKKNELLLITCSDKKGERLLVMLKEVL